MKMEAQFFSETVVAVYQLIWHVTEDINQHQHNCQNGQYLSSCPPHFCLLLIKLSSIFFLIFFRFFCIPCPTLVTSHSFSSVLHNYPIFTVIISLVCALDHVMFLLHMFAINECGNCKLIIHTVIV
jgi:hypothetical protein